ncbi:hypothetical protein ACIP8I_03045 [Pseudomonas sp. NPDC088414]|uniref:hypothetical protein n=1 Tax=Pseudomonas sp. NPDC088414 TaxID=3364454 RepID=UPI0038298C01
MTTTRKNDRKPVRDELSFLDVRQAVVDGQKAFDEFVISGELPVAELHNSALLSSPGSFLAGGRVNR